MAKKQEAEQVRITVSIDKKSAAKIAELAERMNASQSKMASWLLEAGLEDNERIIRIVTSRITKGLAEALKKVGGASKRSKRST